MNSRIFVNLRSLTASLGGVQRYTTEVQKRLASRTVAIAPSKPLQGVQGHLWEQVVLPAVVRKGLLWSPANSGPLSIANQVLTIHDIASVEHPEWFNSSFAAWYSWLVPALIKRVQRVITVSKFSRERLLGLVKIDDSKVVVVPGGVDDRFCPRSGEEIASVRRELGIPSPYYVLSVCTLEPRKNLRRLLTAWSFCTTRLPEEIWLVVAGVNGTNKVFRDAEMRDIPARVKFAGFVADDGLPALYSGALALVYVSIYEGFGLPALEAMASGTVPIVADNSSLPEVVGDAGIRVNPYDPEEIAAAIERVIENSELRRVLSARAIRRSCQFSWDSTTTGTWNVLSEATAS